LARLGARLAARRRPAIQAGAPSGLPIVAAHSSRGRDRRVLGCGDQAGKVGDPRQQRRDHHKFVVAAGQMRRRARPGPFLGAGDEASRDRVERDIPRGGKQMRLVHHDGAKAALEQMASPAEPRIDRPV
jgi:hypothetical protein